MIGIWTAVAALLLTAACGTSPAPGGPDPTDPPTIPPAETSTASVYYLIDTRAGFRLAREARQVTGDPLTGAVETMIAGPLDPDYATTWNPETEVLDVTREGSVVTVDLSGDAATANAGSEAATLMIQQLVHTVADTAGEDVAVQLLLDGEVPEELWGVTTWPEPVTTADPLDVRLLVQIDSLTEGDEVTSPVTVSGEAAVFEANLLWEVQGTEGERVESGFTTTAEGQTFAPYSFDVELEPGQYTVVIVEDDASGGEGGVPMRDSRTITVS